MAVTDTRVPYEILIRLSEDGAVGAHVQYRRIIIIDGEKVKDEVLPAAPLDLSDLPTSGLMNEVTKAAIARAAALESDYAQLAETAAQQVKALTDRIAELEALIPPKDQQ